MLQETIYAMAAGLCGASGAMSAKFAFGKFSFSHNPEVTIRKIIPLVPFIAYVVICGKLRNFQYSDVVVLHKITFALSQYNAAANNQHGNKLSAYGLYLYNQHLAFV